MLTSLRNIPIFRRLFIVFAFAAVVPILVIVLLGNFYLQSLAVRDQAVQAITLAQHNASEHMDDLQHMNALLQTRFIQVFVSNQQKATPVPGGGATVSDSDIRSLQTQFARDLTTYQRDYSLMTSDAMGNVRTVMANNTNSTAATDQQSVLNAVPAEWTDYKTQQENVLSALDQTTPNFQVASAALNKANQSFATLHDGWEKVLDKATDAATAISQTSSAIATPLYVASAIAILLTVLVIVAAGFFVATTITRPLNQLLEFTQRVDAGETNARVSIEGRDEISLLANTVNGVLDNIVKLVQQARERHVALQAQLEKLVNEVSGLGEGDLSIQAEVTTDELGVLADSFNFIAEELSILVVNVKKLAREVQTSTTQTYEHMARLVEDADSQIKQIESATVEVNTMAASSRQVADRAQVFYTAAHDARRTAQSGRHAVRQTVESMERVNDNVRAASEKVQSLGERSREINNIVKVISGIAHQTNRLALDSAIQAAMAGENGKGFGAVAADIRRLAERAKEQTTIINQIVRDVLDDINLAAFSMRDTEQATSAGTQLTQQVGTALESIFQVVEQQANEVGLINQAAMQQLQSSNTVVRIMQNVSDATQQSSSTTHNAAQQMERLARLAGQLLSSVEVFKLREDRMQSSIMVSEAEQQPGQLSFSGPFPAISTNAQSMHSGVPFGGPERSPAQVPFAANPLTPYPPFPDTQEAAGFSPQQQFSPSETDGWGQNTFPAPERQELQPQYGNQRGRS